MKWLNRTLIYSPYCFALCLDEKDFYRELTRLGISREDWPAFVSSKSANATCHFLERSSKAEKACIVCVGDTSGREQEEVYGLLVHEAVHIWRAIKEDIRETEPSSEFEAYSIQAISQELMSAFSEAQKKKGRKKG